MLIDDKYKVESDSLNVTLYYKQKPRKASQPERWRPLAYFSNPHNALHYLVEKEIMGTGMTDFKLVCEKIDELESLINALKGLPQLLESAPHIVKDKTGGKHRARVLTA